MKKVTIQGVAGSFHEQTVKEYFAAESVEIVECETFAEMFSRMSADRSLMGAMAIENTIAGSLLQNHDLLQASDLKIVGEHKLHISHCVAALPGETIADIKEVNSHPIALMQCQKWLGEHPSIKVVEKGDTASSAKEIASRQLRGRAAICSKYAAQLYGLNILEEGVETNKRNFTRFLILADRSVAEGMVDAGAINKASLVFSLPHSAGSLSKVLSILSFYDLNLSKIQSLPIVGREWEYLFYINLSFDSRVRFHQGLEAVRPLTNDLKILGEYVQCSNPKCSK
ncbi:MAG: prephenate dehydratase [Rikenellaceae bacterium]